MRDWVREHPRTDLTRARPADLSPYGVDRDEARERFSTYVQALDLNYDGI